MSHDRVELLGESGVARRLVDPLVARRSHCFSSAFVREPMQERRKGAEHEQLPGNAVEARQRSEVFDLAAVGQVAPVGCHCLGLGPGEARRDRPSPGSTSSRSLRR